MRRWVVFIVATILLGPVGMALTWNYWKGK